jgi:hypothetical protein
LRQPSTATLRARDGAVGDDTVALGADTHDGGSILKWRSLN